MNDARETTVEMALDVLPAGAKPIGVVAEGKRSEGRPALRVVLDPAKRAGKLGTDFGDEPTFVLLPVTISDGIIEVDVLSRLLPDAPDYARGFVGIAYRIQGEGQIYESVYIRPQNGLRLSPPPPRNVRAVQYYAYPDWKFDRLRQEDPDGGYEAAADIAPGEWIALRLELDGPRLGAYVNGVEVLRLRQAKAMPKEGHIGLWVDIGTDGYFSNLRVSRR
jgi:hypothetical protein